MEVDLECPENLHDKANDFPMASEKIKVTEEMLAPIQLKTKKEHDIEVGTTNKLLPNLLPKKNYVVQYRNLKYLSKGSILIKVYEILEFKQSPWMKPYIDFNTERRKEATNKADKDLLKLFNNTVYDKTMENMRNRVKVRVTTTEKEFLKYASRPTFINHNIYGKDFVVINEKKKALRLNKPVYVGCTVLELSKLAMYDFCYGSIEEKLNNSNILYMDTDCFIIEVIGENFDDVMFEDK